MLSGSQIFMSKHFTYAFNWNSISKCYCCGKSIHIQKKYFLEIAKLNNHLIIEIKYNSKGFT